MKMSTKIDKKINFIFQLMKRLANGEELYPQNILIQQEFGVNERTLRRYLEDIHNLYRHIIAVEKKQKELSDKKVTVYRVIDREKDVSEIFRFFLKESNDLSWLLQIAHDYEPKLLYDERDRFEKILKENKDIYIFIGSPFEDLSSEHLKKIFNDLKTAVKNFEYRDIYKKDSTTLYNVKCLKLVHMSNNWYIAIETESGKFDFLRLSFIDRVKYSKKVSYKPNILEKYYTLFSSIQNPMTLNRPFKTAHLKASSKIAHYFKKDMKPFFPSQEYKQTLEDGSIEFTIKFTQPMEILPFIKQWLPEITIVAPQELKKVYIEDLQKALENENR